ncbi:MAG: hypothetical protein A3J47_01250 [Candidatus Yanofskybacteria bacterium RIFCSPHIGHO2_02_FULL_43_22]|uniref:Uncharacterized protein n=1 Tax=Candidatus Yanofskybacteria bacterium RIFCSPHIGHO2_02_FULL_43_22 TaxID=1802681 RepID=A0A1F8FKN6_9BACT|nr:MAG: hypothetical protein A3J47_01250 [Candidatus Yanofskybacteria bacterium RIFCSPHIGHO2_02_FULL_43_22]
MLKSIHLKLLKIKYGDDSVGRNIRVEVKVLDKFLRIDKRIKSGAMSEINYEVGRIETDQELFQAEVFITVIEKDFLFNDIGRIRDNIKINTAVTQPQQFVFEVQVKESRSIFGKFWGSKTAVFEVELEVEVNEIERYIPSTKDGWFVTWNEKDEKISLSEYIKVNPKYIRNEREYFVPLEGVYRDELLSAKLQDNGSSYLISEVQYKPMAKATYSISKKTFTLNGKKYKAIDYPDAPWKRGTYNIGIPDYPHGNNDSYIEAKRQKVWFGVDFEKERYLHVGARSLGCMTIIETARWMEIYSILIVARKGDFKSVGEVSVID